MTADTIDEILSAWQKGEPFESTVSRIRVELSSSLPVFGFALHSGSLIRDELSPKLNLDRQQMLYEEDPGTDELLHGLPNRICPFFSRFECDLNRPQKGKPVETAVYTDPSLAWGLEVYRPLLDPDEIRESLDPYRQFYRLVESLCRDMEDRIGYGVLIDMHSYNNRGREGLPDINLGTLYQDRELFSGLIAGLSSSLKRMTIQGRSLVVRENDRDLKFYGGSLNRWVAKRFKNILVISLELKKFFMDEGRCIFHQDIFFELKTALNIVFSTLTTDIQKRIQNR